MTEDEKSKRSDAPKYVEHKPAHFDPFANAPKRRIGIWAGMKLLFKEYVDTIRKPITPIDFFIRRLILWPAILFLVVAAIELASGFLHLFI
jgi:hypothetical protein